MKDKKILSLVLSTLAFSYMAVDDVSAQVLSRTNSTIVNTPHEVPKEMVEPIADPKVIYKNDTLRTFVKATSTFAEIQDPKKNNIIKEVNVAQPYPEDSEVKIHVFEIQPKASTLDSIRNEYPTVEIKITNTAQNDHRAHAYKVIQGLADTD